MTARTVEQLATGSGIVLLVDGNAYWLDHQDAQHDHNDLMLCPISQNGDILCNEDDTAVPAWGQFEDDDAIECRRIAALLRALEDAKEAAAGNEGIKPGLAQLAGSLDALLEYNWKDEEEDWKDHYEEPGHIFAHMKRLALFANWLQGRES